MILGVILGEFAPSVRVKLDTVKLHGVSLPIAIGLIIMMWPVLTKVQYETLPGIFQTKRLWKHLFISLILNWIVGPFLMLGLAWATLPDLPGYRTGVIMVGLARCIAMVVIWNDLARGNTEYCAILVVVNALLQIALFSPYSVFFINIISHTHDGSEVAYGNVAISVLIYLGIPLVAGIVTRYGVIAATSREFFEGKFLEYFSPVALIGLLYTIVVLFAYQGHRILHDIGPVFRICVPQILYFFIMWTGTFFLIHHLSKRESMRVDGKNVKTFGYDTAVSQAFTAASNNFELAIAVCIAVYGIDSEQALAASIGPLTEVPVLLGLSWVALSLRYKLTWEVSETQSGLSSNGEGDSARFTLEKAE
ncbi:hypothetical protein HYPSUDRAFT_132716 [Hypholoma sublateritium FD-334 SS-4]|uniref:Arsenical-resistance protein n=1 Tax=Hypholoma sublateritium (strain FD-334 SS-4) TaxID=945553 RepID=A0A0D2P6X3_HYPSF|nr:hypothetical protein HYPSUDRAFT_132716 [Hypholoma sublateritium FD-334 SS-4]